MGQNRGLLMWVDSKNGELADDKDVRGRYEKEILTHAGVRLVGES
jgi:3-oxoacyl-ACP reductase-like protein